MHNYQDFANLEFKGGHDNFKQKYRPNSANFTVFETLSEYGYGSQRPPTATSADFRPFREFENPPAVKVENHIQVKFSRTPSSKALKIVLAVTGVFLSVVAVVALIACLIIFVGNDHKNDHKNNPPPQYPTKIPGDKGTSLVTGSVDTSAPENAISSTTGYTTTPEEGTIQTATTGNTPIISSTTESITTNSISGVGTWSIWGSWTMCSVTCGDALHARYRTCIKSSSTDIDCVGDFKEEGICTTSSCPVYGQWSTWESWSICDVTCGGGIQTRTRTCQKSESTNNDCVGRLSMTQACNEWDCPDCFRTCPVGVLNSECDACECSSFNINGLVINTNGAPMQNVTISHASAPWRVLTTTTANGSFELNVVCNQQGIMFQAQGYQDVTLNISSSTITVTMNLIVYPVITQQPQSRFRLKDENVEFCCIADGNPPVTSYEWLKDGNILDGSLYPTETMLSLTNLTFEDSAKIVCRANSPAGAVYSNTVTLAVRDTPSEFCSDAFEPYEIELPYDCVQADTNSTKFNVGRCSPRSCRGNNTNNAGSCTSDNKYCCISATYESRTVQCTGYSLPIYITTSCGCGECAVPDITIKGKALGLSSGLPLRFGSIKINGTSVGVTGFLGDFSFSVPVETTRIVATFEDTIFKNFMDTMKIIKMDEDTFGTFYINVRMIEKQPSVDIDSTLPNTLQLGNDSGSESIASITIPADSIYYPNGTKYDGIVKASINFFDPRNSTSIQNAPGEFSYTDQEGQSQSLQSFGVFSVSLQDLSGLSLQIAGEAEIRLDADLFEATSFGSISDAKIWGLNPDTGLWEETGQLQLVTARRRKRYTSSRFLVGSMIIDAYTWKNLDVSFPFRWCKFKAKIFKNTEEMIPYLVRTIHMSVPGSNYGLSGTVATFYENYMSSDYRIWAACSDSNQSLGYIEAEVNGEKVPVDMDNTGIATSTMDTLDYSVTFDARSVFVKFTILENGPFYDWYNRTATFSNFFRFSYQSSGYSYTVLNHPFQTALSTYASRSHMLWYPPFNALSSYARYKMCFIKIGTENANSNLKFRVTSQYDLTGDVVGVREKLLTNGSACIEYRCSGPIPLLDTFTFRMSYTEVTISPVNQLCTVLSESAYIRSKEKDFLGEAEKSDIGKTYFEANVPDIEDTGLYVSKVTTALPTQAFEDFEIQECYAGVVGPTSPTMDPDTGLAVKFQCL